MSIMDLNEQVIAVIKPALIGNLRQGQVGLPHQALSVHDPGKINIIRNLQAGVGLEGFENGAFADVEFPGKFRYGNAFVVILGNVFHDFLREHFIF